MNYLSPHDKRQRALRGTRAAAVIAFGLLLTLFLDQFAFELVTPLIESTGDEAPRVDKARYELHDWYRFLRIQGFAGTWAAVAVLLALHDRATGHPTHDRALRLIGAVVVAGLAAELLKLVVGRERPIEGSVFQGDVYKPFLGAVLNGSEHGGNLGFPSSHTSTAFAAATALAAFFPSTRWVLFALAAGCGLSRMLTGAHWLSDVYAGAIIGILGALLFVPKSTGSLITSSR
ncbi:MAG: phosphatase PAP2 family protein [Planctomycetota bacterium]